MTSTHKPVNIITQILQKHQKKEKQDLHRIIGSARKFAPGKVDVSHETANRSTEVPRRDIKELKNDKTPNFASMVNIENTHAPESDWVDPFDLSGGKTSVGFGTQTQSVSNMMENTSDL